MKEFSDYEKNILQELIRIDEIPGSLSVLGNIIDRELTPNFYIELKSENNCPVRIAKSFIDKIATKYGNIGLNETMKQFNNKLLFIVKLLEYLEHEKLIYFNGELPISILGTTFDVNETPVGYELLNNETANKLYYYSRRIIVPEDSLKKFVKNNFKEDEKNMENDEIQKKMLWYQRKMFYIAIIALIIGAIPVIIIFYPLKDKNSENNSLQDTSKVSPNIINSPKDTIEIKTALDTSQKNNITKEKDNEKYLAPKKKSEQKKTVDQEKEEIKKGVMDEFNK